MSEGALGEYPVRTGRVPPRNTVVLTECSYVGTNLVAGVETAAPERFAHQEEALQSTLDGFAWLCRHDIRPAFSPWTVAAGSAWENKTPPGTPYVEVLRHSVREITCKRESFNSSAVG